MESVSASTHHRSSRQKGSEFEFRSLKLAEVPAVASQVREVFGVTPDENLWQSAGRVLLTDRRVRGGLCVQMTPQYIGGGPIPTGGVAWVFVPPEARGKGIARLMLTQALHELRASGAVLSSVYPSTLALYRHVGYEVAGTLTIYGASLPLHSRGIVSEEPLGLEPWGVESLPEIQACYRRFAASTSGLIERSAERWLRVVEDRPDNPVSRYLVRDQGAVTGYVVYAREPASGAFEDYAVRCRDLICCDAPAFSALLRFFAAQGTLARRLHWCGPVDDPLLLAFEQQQVRPEQTTYWVSRVLNVLGALKARRYPPDVQAVAEIHVDDSVFRDNAQPFRIEVSGGEGCVQTPGSGPYLRLGVGTLASLYTGWLRATEAARVGLIQGGPDRQLVALDQMFAGPKPWLLEPF